MKPVIFLDIDGVLNRRETDWDNFQLDPELVSRFNELVKKTDAHVVLSSTWRQVSNWRSLMKEHGLDFEFLDCTSRNNSRTRGAEIYSWLSKNRDLTVYAIIDDQNEMVALQKSHFFQTDWRQGLTKEIADAVEEYLVHKLAEAKA